MTLAPAISSGQSIKRKYGFPYKGFTSSVPAHMCPKDYIWGAGNGSSTTSANVLYDPNDGKFYPRAGSTTVGSTAGLLESITPTERWRARKLIELNSPSISTGYPTHSALFTDETNNVAALYLRSPTGGVDYQLGEEMNGVIQAVTLAAGGSGYSVGNVLTIAGGTGGTVTVATLGGGGAVATVTLTTGGTGYSNVFAAAVTGGGGSGATFNLKIWHYAGSTAATFNVKCVPYYRTTDGSFGRLATADTRSYAFAGSRGMQESGGWLHLPGFNSTPLKWNQRYNESTSSGSENLRLRPGGIPPMIAGNLGIANLNASGVWQANDTFYFSVAYQYSDGSVSMPVIPRGINAELTGGFCKMTVSSSCDTVVWLYVPIGPDGVVGRWLLRTPKVNTTTNPGVPIPSPLDLMVTGYISNNTQTTYIDTNGNDLGLSDRPDIVRFDRILQPAARYIGNFDGRNIVGYTKPNPIAIFIGCVSNTSIVADDDVNILAQNIEFDVGVTSATKITFFKDNVQTFQVDLGTNSIQYVIDKINGTFSWSSTVQPVACLAPGADLLAAASNLALTTSCNTGDTSGRIRVFAQSLPAPLMYKTTYLSDFPTEKRRWFFTQGGPGVQSNLSDAYLAGNYRTGLDSWGILQGFAPLLEGSLIFFSKAVVLFRNIKSGKSGLDDDYHPDDLFTNIGCIAWDSIAHGDGWAGCLTDRGYAVFDGTRGGMRIISSDVYNPATGEGEWAYEIGQCLAATGADTDGAHFHAKAMGGVLRVTYRSSSANTSTLGIPDRYMEYNYSLTSSGTGLDQVLRSDGSPWGWSAPCSLGANNFGVMGEVRTNTTAGISRYGVADQSASSPRERVVQFETGAIDTDTVSPNGITNTVYGPLDLAGGLKRRQAQKAVVVHRGITSNMTMQLIRSNGRTTSSLTSALPLPTTTDSTGIFRETVVPIPSKGRGPAVAHQYLIVNTGSSSDTTGAGLALWGLELDLIETNSYRGS